MDGTRTGVDVAAGDLLTTDGQIEWRGNLLGAGTNYRYVDLQGWLDLPDFRGDDQPRPSRHGMFPSASLMGKRVVTYDYLLGKGVTLANFPAAVAALQAMTAPTEDPQEEPLVVQLAGAKWLSNVRCKKRSIPTDKQFALGYTQGAIQWEATDPRLYSPALHTIATGLVQAATTGLPFPLVSPLDFGAGGSGGFLTATNIGNLATWPTYTLTGPVTGPIITNHSTGQQLVFKPTFVVAAGQTLTIDSDLRQVTLQGVSVSNALVVRQWFPLLPGVVTRIDLASTGAYSSAVQLTALWRDASV